VGAATAVDHCPVSQTSAHSNGDALDQRRSKSGRNSRVAGKNPVCVEDSGRKTQRTAIRRRVDSEVAWSSVRGREGVDDSEVEHGSVSDSGITVELWREAIEDARKNGQKPPGYLTALQLAEIWGLSIYVTRRELKSLIQRGVVLVGSTGGESISGRRVTVPAYKLKTDGKVY